MLKRAAKIIAAVIVFLLVSAVGGYGAIMIYINHSVEKYSAIAVEAHPDTGDEVLALVEYVKSDSHSLRERNLAVWTLGRIGDPRALEILEAEYTGDKCDHEHALCQHELSNAITLCKSNTK